MYIFRHNVRNCPNISPGSNVFAVQDFTYSKLFTKFKIQPPWYQKMSQCQ